MGKLKYLFLLRGPRKPHEDHDSLENCRGPKCPRGSNGAGSQETSQHCSAKAKNRSSKPSVSLDVGADSCKQLCVGEQVTVDARENNARECVILERTTGNRLTTALEGNQSDRNQHVPVDILIVNWRWSPGDDGRCDGDENRLDGKGQAQDPTPLR